MKFDANKGDRCQVFDSNGVLIPHAISGDTETGVVLSFETDQDGKFFRRGNEIARVCKRYPAPLRLEPLPKEP